MSVDCAKDGAAADAALGTGQFDLPILDIGLPKLSGFEILKRLRNRDSTPPVAANPRARFDRPHELSVGGERTGHA